MTEQLQNKLNLAKKYFEKFTYYIELENFRDYLLFTLNSTVSSNVLAQLGLGSGKNVVNFPYNPIFNFFYQKIELFSAGSLLIYVKTPLISEKFILEKDDPIFKEFLNSNEIDLGFTGKEKFIIPKVSDCASFDNDEDISISLKIDELYHSLESFLAVREPNILFVIDGASEQDADLLFTFNMMPEMPGKANKKILRMDVYLDDEHTTKNIKYLKREEDYKIKFLENIKEISHADLFRSSFSLVIHIKSLDSPY
ncbi:MAG: hypothetical protein GF317_12830 [Candidatus Lokiarchaeota archaeon]|nr:hypothetical protein [Candidatus Lokiarchaeota archaeon]MBD3200526.1 hypothetical protein [Candidatus Lokiarchaeota archaeon]